MARARVLLVGLGLRDTNNDGTPSVSRAGAFALFRTSTAFLLLSRSALSNARPLMKPTVGSDVPCMIRNGATPRGAHVSADSLRYRSGRSDGEKPQRP